MFTEAAQANPLELTTNASILQKIFCLQIVSPFGSVMEKKIFRIELSPSDENWCQMNLQRCDDAAHKQDINLHENGAHILLANLKVL